VAFVLAVAWITCNLRGKQSHKWELEKRTKVWGVGCAKCQSQRVEGNCLAFWQPFKLAIVMTAAIAVSSLSSKVQAKEVLD